MTTDASSSERRGLFDGVLSRGGVRDATSDRAWLQAMLDAEAALAAALVDVGIASPSDADAIRDACRAEHYDADALAVQSASGGNPVIPLVGALQHAVEPPASDHVHSGATSQDILDSAAMLVAQRSLAVITADLGRAADAARALAAEHRTTPMAGRTLLQHAVPTTFGLEAAGWVAGLEGARQRLEEVSRTGLAAQLGGAAGTLAAYGEQGLVMLERFSFHVGLPAPVAPWHTDRTRIAELAGALGTASVAIGKVAVDLVLLASTEVAEVSEQPGRGGSSAMPHKHNPVAAVLARAAAMQAPGLVATLLAAGHHEHQRAAGAWHAEWRPFRELLRAVGSGAASLAEALTGLRVDAVRIRANLDLTGGLVHAERIAGALAPAVGRRAALEIVTEATNRADTERQQLRKVLGEDRRVTEHLDPATLDRLLGRDIGDAIGCAPRIVDAVLARHRPNQE